MRFMKYVFPAIVLLFLFGAYALFVPTSKKSVLGVATSPCDASLWNHVYHPARLKVIEPCGLVSGTIDAVKPEKDGDYHIRLKLDQQYSSLANEKNKSGQGGDLVLEPVCEHAVSQEDAIAACEGFLGSVSMPHVGDHVEVIGSYVLDQEHGWMEIHPVSSITVK